MITKIKSKKLLYISVCFLDVPPNSNIVQRANEHTVYNRLLNVSCIPGYRIQGSSNDNVSRSLVCNENGNLDIAPTCIPKGKTKCSRLK